MPSAPRSTAGTCPSSGGEQRIVRVAASLAAGHPASLRDPSPASTSAACSGRHRHPPCRRAAAVNISLAAADAMEPGQLLQSRMTGSRPTMARSRVPDPLRRLPGLRRRIAPQRPRPLHVPARRERPGRPPLHRALSTSEHAGIPALKAATAVSSPRRTFSLAELTADAPVKNVSPGRRSRGLRGFRLGAVTPWRLREKRRRPGRPAGRLPNPIFERDTAEEGGRQAQPTDGPGRVERPAAGLRGDAAVQQDQVDQRLAGDDDHRRLGRVVVITRAIPASLVPRAGATRPARTGMRRRRACYRPGPRICSGWR